MEFLPGWVRDCAKVAKDAKDGAKRAKGSMFYVADCSLCCLLYWLWQKCCGPCLSLRVRKRSEAFCHDMVCYGHLLLWGR
jgi:hypothetical protein